MTLDPYALCPGGTGKKVKFCCHDLMSELDKVYRMLEGDQYRASLDYLESLDSKYPDRACLLTAKAVVQLRLDEIDEARHSVERLLATQPTNAVALAEAALVEAQSQNSHLAVERLQQAFAASPTEAPPQLNEALTLVAHALALDGHVLAALAHWMLQLQLLPKFKIALESVIQVVGSDRIPLQFKDVPRRLEPCPQDVPWKAQFDSAMISVRRAAWRRAANQLGELAQQVTDSPSIWRNLAVLRANLADNQGAVEALRRLATLDIPLDDAVEAESLAQLLDPKSTSEPVDLLAVSIAVTEPERLRELLDADRRAVRGEPDGWDAEAGPPPMAVYEWLDRPMPESAEGLGEEAIPRTACDMLLFGRQTDLEARLEIHLFRDQVDDILARLRELAGDVLAADAREEIIGQQPRLNRDLSESLRFPSGVSADQVRSIASTHHRRLLLERWPKSPSPFLDGRTPEEAAGDPAQRIRLLAGILNLELFTAPRDVHVVSELRQRLGLPQPEPIDPAVVAVREVPLVYLARLIAEKLSDEDLVFAFKRACSYHARLAARKLAQEVIARSSMDGKNEKSEAYGTLLAIEDDLDRMLELIRCGRAAAQAAGQSLAAWDLEELKLQMLRGDATQAERLLNHVLKEHGDKPGVQRRIFQLLYEAGMIDERGRPIEQPTPEPALVVPGGAAEAGKLWTPDSELAGGKKATLWTPGRD